MKIGFAAFTVGPSNMLKIVAERASKAGHETIQLPPQEKGAAEKRMKELASCDVIAIGPSSFNPEEEGIIVETLWGQVPIVVVEDVPGAALRPQIQPIVGKVTAAIVAMPGWEEKVIAWGYPRAVYLGPPAHWKKSFEDMRRAIEGVNPRHDASKIRRGISGFMEKGDVLLYYSGIKTPWINARVLRLMIDIGRDLFGDRLVVGFRPHPAEFRQTPNDVELVVLRERMLKDANVWVLETGTTSAASWMAVADITVLAGGSTDGIMGAFHRLPQVHYEDTDTIERDKQQSPDGKWWVAEIGGALKASGHVELHAALGALSTPSGKLHLRFSQEKSFPVPLSWETATMIVDFLEKSARRA